MSMGNGSLFHHASYESHESAGQQDLIIGTSAAKDGSMASSTTEVFVRDDVASHVVAGAGEVTLSPSPATTPFVVALPVSLPKLQGDACEPSQLAHRADFASTANRFYAMPVSQAPHSFHPELPPQHIPGYDALTVYKGLAGFYSMFDDVDSGNENDPSPAALRLPSGVGQYDIALVFQDKRFDVNGFLLNPSRATRLAGDKLCVNGKVQPFFNVERRKYRFRLINGGPSRMYAFHLNYEGIEQPMQCIAVDGHLLAAPMALGKLCLEMTRRADIVIDFSKYPEGTQLFIMNTSEQPGGSASSHQAFSPGTSSVLRFDVGRLPPRPDISRVPATLRMSHRHGTAPALGERIHKDVNGVFKVGGGLSTGAEVQWFCQPFWSPQQYAILSLSV
jgi:hypothetical protein